eukprot:CAMPEP_0114342128 /NCGR_PEP_ID=MMETSP0101-20121206/9559_1 /TAXON_ID=38822 ORGANISM="Pteridomonas danica, Strain PT" /NCGR_SAMPLE_ID=MMETSP0101 /ASSEMBLY_ACC=CAM_ASM_000211 /LENGTH=508 /DNA_ID=CAMNT_0001476065 /DNA_START=281 /DNA_END=1807 /DNA_ORIENTATION=-
MKSDKACRNFRVDIRSSSYFACQCGHPKSAHAFSPLPEEEELFVGSSGITPKWDVEEEQSEIRSSVLSFGDAVSTENMRQPIPCLDEFTKHFKERKQALQQPRITVAEKLSLDISDDDMELTDREVSSERSRSGSEKFRGVHSGFTGLRAGGRSALSADSTSSPSSSITGHKPPEHVMNRSHEGVAKFLNQQRLRETETWLRDEVEREYNALMLKKAEDYEKEMVRRYHDAVTAVQEQQQATIEEVEANYRAQLEAMQEQCVEQLDEIELNAKAHILEVQKSFEQAEKSKEKRNVAMIASLRKQVEAQQEQLIILRRYRDAATSTTTNQNVTRLRLDSARGASGGGSGGGNVNLKTAVRRLSRDQMMGGLEQLNEADEEDEPLSPQRKNKDFVKDTDVNNEKMKTDNVDQVQLTEEETPSSYTDIRKPEMSRSMSSHSPRPHGGSNDDMDNQIRNMQMNKLIVVAFVALLGLVSAIHFGIRSLADFRQQVLLPAVYYITRWLQGFESP